MKKQIHIEFEIDNFTTSYAFLVIPYLSSNVILGNDWGFHNGIIINYKDRTISIKENVLSNHSVLFEESTADKILLAQRNELTLIYLIKINEFEKINLDNNKIETNNVELIINDEMKELENEILIGALHIDVCYNNYESSKTNNISKGDNVNIKEINQVSTYNVNKEIVNTEYKTQCEAKFSEELSSIACKLTALSELQKNTFLNLLWEKRRLFFEKPHSAYGYEHCIKIKKQNPVIYRNYSVPIA